MKLIKRMATGLLILILAFALTGCNEKTENKDNKETVKIAYLPLTHALPLFVEAELQKDNSDIRIELVKYGSWTELMDALNTGRVDGASVLIELAIRAKEEGIDLKSVALGHKDGNVIVVKKEKNDIADLKGKTFAIPHRQSSHNILLRQMLEENGLSEEDITIVELPPPEMPSALAQGQIDGYCVAEPFGAKSVALDTGKVLYESGDLWEDSICCSLVLTNDFIKNRSSVAKEFISKYAEAGKYITENKEEADEIAKKYLDVDDKVLDLSMEWISYDDLAVTEEAYADLINRILKFNLSENPPAYEDFVDSSLLK